MKDEDTILIQDVMQNNYVVIDGKETVQSGLKILIEKNIDVLIIEKRHEDDEYGIVLLADIAKKVLGANRAAQRVNLYEIMTKPVIGVRAGMKVHYCARLFQQFGLSLAPVFDNDKLVGVIGYRDLVKLYI